MTALHTSINNNTSTPSLRKPPLSSGSTITSSQATQLLEFVIPVTLPYTDAQGRTIQLWNFRKSLIASVSLDEQVIILSGKHITNPLKANQSSQELLQRLESGGLRKWQFSYSEATRKIVIWPHIVAAGKDGPSPWKPPVFLETPDCLGHIFKKDDGHLAKDTPQNRAYISQAVSHPCNKVATDSFGNDIYVKTFPDGSQAWAIVRDNEIRDGGRNEPPRKWVTGHSKHGGQLKDFYAATSFTVRPSRSPATAAFRQLLQQTHLTESYNGSHPHRPVAARGATSGQIGGMGHKLGMIEGLFDHPEALHRAP